MSNIIHIGDAAKRVVGKTSHNKMLIDRIQGAPAQSGTAETDADPRNPRQVSMDGPTGKAFKASVEFMDMEAERGRRMIEKGLNLLRDNAGADVAICYLQETLLAITGSGA